MRIHENEDALDDSKKTDKPDKPGIMACRRTQQQQDTGGERNDGNEFKMGCFEDVFQYFPVPGCIKNRERAKDDPKNAE
jgi:hypothetical protein